MKTKPSSQSVRPGLFLVLLALTVAHFTQAADPRTNSWLTTFSGKYARIYTTDVNKTNGTAVTTWNNGTQNQSNVVYCGVQEVYSSGNWVYVRSTGLGAHVMGPWYGNAAHTTTFPNYPLNQKAFWRFPRTNSMSITNAQTALGTIGFFVDGVAMFDTSDGFVWTGSTEAGNGTGYWHREAYANEGATFDPGFAHQENSGTHHYHGNPIALRYLLGDNVNFNPTNKMYSESTNTPTKHSPILGWVKDGYPIYGPYAYSNALNPNTPLIRMRTGFQLRDGTRGTDNITNTGAARATIPLWAQRLYNTNANQAGPNVSSTYPYARYMEDYAYLGDLTNNATGTNYKQDADFDLDEHNGRFCITPEFPQGTYAYFVSMNADGTPKYPNNIGRTYYGYPIGGSVSSVTETVTTNFLGNTNLSASISTPAFSNGTMTLKWTALEGGTYQVESTTNFSSWTTNATGIAAGQTNASYSYAPSSTKYFYRTKRTAVATFDSPGVTAFSAGGYGITSISPTSGSRGAVVNLTINIDSSVNPPPSNAPINSITVGSITCTNSAHVSNTQVTTGFYIPAGATTGAQTIVLVFPGPPTNAAATVTYSLTNAFTIN